MRSLTLSMAEQQNRVPEPLMSWEPLYSPSTVHIYRRQTYIFILFKELFIWGETLAE